MKYSEFFIPTVKDAPSDAEIISHKLMIKAGMIKQSSAGIYSWLPLGLKVLKNIEQIVREEQNNAGANEMLMPTIQSADLWIKSGRYDDYGKEMLRILDRSGNACLSSTTPRVEDKALTISVLLTVNFISLRGTLFSFCNPLQENYFPL